MRQAAILLSVCLGLAACNSGADQDTPAATASAPDDNMADAMASNDQTAGQGDTAADAEQRPVMQMQVVLDRLGFAPGVIDGKMGASTNNALKGFQEANDLEVTGEANDETRQALQRWRTIPATRVVTIPEDFADIAFQPVPDGAAAQAKMQRLGYASLTEKLAERFHTTPAVLETLNPGGRPATSQNQQAASTPSASPSPSPTPSASPTSGDGDAASRPEMFRAGQQIRVPNTGADRIARGSVDDRDWLATLQSLGVGSQQPEAERIVVSKSEGTLKVFDAQDKLIAMYTATMGSSHDPLPLGDWTVKGVAHNPPFEFDASLFWDVADSAADQTLPPGPNGPVGVVWIDLSKEHYGIHGTPEPQTIGTAESHGCVRLTNWDAARLAQMVSPGTKVLFEA